MRGRNFSLGTFALGYVLLPISITIKKIGAIIMSEKRPNLLIIQTDQQSCWTIGAYGTDEIETPNIDRLAREGAIFNNYFTVSAVCTPSRGCFLTGRYPHCHGAYQNNIELSRDEMTLALILSANGYKTGYAGKWHLDGEAKPGWMKAERAMGFLDCRYMYNRGHWKAIKEDEDNKGVSRNPIEEEGVTPAVSDEIGNQETYTTDWLTDKTIDFIKQERNNPFFYMVSIPDPHIPFSVREPYASMFKKEDMSVPETFYEENRPDWIEKAGTNLHNRGWTEDNVREAKTQYYGMVKCIDDNLGRILDTLSDEDILDNTIIVFTTDHGEYLGEHGIYEKNQLYETAYRIPLLLRWPQKIRKNIRVDRLVSIVDFQPTILSLMDIEASGREQGQDVSPLLIEKTNYNIDKKLFCLKDEVYIHHSSFERAGIFTDKYELGLLKEGDNILFDRINDPLQVNNLYNNNDYQEIIEELTEKIIEHNRKYESPALKWLEEL